MTRKLEKGRLVAATHNKGKVRELKDLFEPVGMEVVSAIDLDLPEPEETEQTFSGNALIKARAACEATGAPALSDDSGLEVTALGGMPGVHTAIWAGEPRDFAMAMRNVEEKLQATGATTPEKRRATFVAVLCLARPGHEPIFFRGEVGGTIVWPPVGYKGFGYDPIFLPEGESRTFGEMMSAEKHAWAPGQRTALSHRARAFQKFAKVALGVE